MTNKEEARLRVELAYVENERDELLRKLSEVENAWREYHIKCPDTIDEAKRRERARKNMEKLLK
jgi:hypothetical protein